MAEPAKSDRSAESSVGGAAPVPPADAQSAIASPAAPAPNVPSDANPMTRKPAASIFALRRPIPLWMQAVLGIACVTVCLVGWWWVTRGAEDEQRMVAHYALPSPRETFEALPDLWFNEDHPLTRSTLTTLGRLALGFGLAALIGVPLGV